MPDWNFERYKSEANDLWENELKKLKSQRNLKNKKRFSILLFIIHF
ncbi:MAG: hypothetical protein IPM77_04815 [Crocinitomicaceae bacterium]|nr:hypothetical protein [Crocinitomicaceae bacterium]